MELEKTNLEAIREKLNDIGIDITKFKEETINNIILKGKETIPLKVTKDGKEFFASIQIKREKDTKNREKIDVIINKSYNKLLIPSDKFNNEEREKLLKEGHIMKTFENDEGKKQDVIVSVDTNLRRLRYNTIDDINIPSKLRDFQLTEENRSKLKRGEEISIEMDKTPFLVRINGKGDLEFNTEESKQNKLLKLKSIPILSEEETEKLITEYQRKNQKEFSLEIEDLKIKAERKIGINNQEYYEIHIIKEGNEVGVLNTRNKEIVSQIRENNLDKETIQSIIQKSEIQQEQKKLNSLSKKIDKEIENRKMHEIAIDKLDLNVKQEQNKKQSKNINQKI